MIFTPSLSKNCVKKDCELHQMQVIWVDAKKQKTSAEMHAENQLGLAGKYLSKCSFVYVRVLRLWGSLRKTPFAHLSFVPLVSTAGQQQLSALRSDQDKQKIQGTLDKRQRNLLTQDTNRATFHQNIAWSLAARTTNGLDFRYSAEPPI